MSEMKKNLFRKMNRMKVLEAERNTLPESDLYDNIKTAVKSALYMYYRAIYNDRIQLLFLFFLLILFYNLLNTFS